MDKLFGRYKLVRQVWDGAMSSVYEARDQCDGARVAIKYAKGGEASHLRNNVLRLEREAVALWRLRHPCIVRMIDARRHGDSYCLVVEYLEGMTIAEKIYHDSHLPYAVAVKVMLSVLSALNAVHGLGLVHRDIKAENVMLSNGRIKLLDFGLVTMPTRKGPRRITEPMVTVGTPSCMAPEACEAVALRWDARADLYGCGHMLYEMLTGRHAFGGEARRNASARSPSPQILLMQQVHMPPLLFADAVPELRIPEGLERVVMRALEKRPEDRFQSAAEMSRALLDAVP